MEYLSQATIVAGPQMEASTRHRAGYSISGITERQAPDNRAGYNSSGPTEADKHKTIEQAKKVEAHRDRQAQDSRAGYKSSGSTVGGST